MSSSLNLDVTVLSQVLTVAQKLAIRNALLKIKMQENLSDIKFWGKIAGLQQDYFVAVSTSLGSTITKNFYWSNDEGATFAQLSAPDEFVSHKSPKIRGLFTGNPALKYKDPDAGPKLDEDGMPVESDEEEDEEEEEEAAAGDEDEMDEEGNPVVRAPPPRRLNELERLSFCVRQIDHSTALVPRGSVYMSAIGTLGKNVSFEGLSIEDAQKLSNFQLLRAPEQAATLAAIRKAGVSNHHNCLDAIVPETGASASQSKGASGANAWALHVSEGGLVVSLRSLLFPGFEFCLEAGTNNYAGAYFGLGEKNDDLLFML